MPFAVKFDKLSLASCFIELHLGDHKIGHASGFFWRKANDLFLITNWHVVTGKNPFTKLFLKAGQCPDHLKIHYTIVDAPSPEMISILGATAKGFAQKTLIVPLFKDYNSPFWIQHKECLSSGIDVVALKLDNSHLGISPAGVVCFNDYGFTNLFHYIGGDVLVIGYPLDEPGLKLPVWKRGSIASELLVPWQNKPAFLVDCRTSSGMSGSPTIRRVFGPATFADLTTNLNNVVTSEFMGVYSGRLHDDENVASIGLVWHREVVDQILTNPSPGDRG
jgi:hypothetical protein